MRGKDTNAAKHHGYAAGRLSRRVAGAGAPSWTHGSHDTQLRKLPVLAKAAQPRPLRAALAPRASPLASSYSQAKMDGRPRTSEQPPARFFGEDTKVNDSFCVVTCRFSARLLKGNKARIHPALRRTFIQVEPNACGKLKLSGRPARKMLTSDWLGAESSSNRPVQKNPSWNPNPNPSGSVLRRPRRPPARPQRVMTVLILVEEQM